MAVSVGRSRLPELLTKNNLSQTKFADLMGISDAFVTKVKKNERFFSYQLSIKAAHILNCLVEELHEIEINED
jgi:transcriptional regulator with XRE-family HTH domain